MSAASFLGIGLVALNGFDGLITDRLPSRLANRDVPMLSRYATWANTPLPWLIAYVKPCESPQQLAPWQ